jgi:transcriptional antiterminator RfaH
LERWYAVHTHPNRETIAGRHLLQQGFKAFVPRYAKQVRHARQCKAVMAPLFPRYLFVALDLRRHRWRSVNGTRGVATLVMQNGLPTPVAAGAVEALLERSGDDEVVKLDELRPGQSVRVVAGPFAEQIGVLQRLSGPERVRLLLEMMHGQISIELTRADVAPRWPARPSRPCTTSAADLAAATEIS